MSEGVVDSTVSPSTAVPREGYFALLGLPNAFDIDEKALHKAYMIVQRACHPDVLARKPDAERMAGMQRSVDANNAYKTLKNPLKRAEYLLEREAVFVGSQAGAVKASQMLLMESMELREALFDAQEEAQLQMMAQSAQVIQVDVAQEFAKFWMEKDLANAAQTAIRWRFVEKYCQEISQKIATL